MSSSILESIIVNENSTSSSSFSSKYASIIPCESDQRDLDRISILSFSTYNPNFIIHVLTYLYNSCDVDDREKLQHQYDIFMKAVRFECLYKFSSNTFPKAVSRANSVLVGVDSNITKRNQQARKVRDYIIPWFRSTDFLSGDLHILLAEYICIEPIPNTMMKHRNKPELPYREKSKRLKVK